jgi:putative transposase
MDYQANISTSHAVYSIRLHLVLVTKYRRKVLTENIRMYLKKTFIGILADWRCELLEFGGEDDHVHLLIDVHPALNISTLVNNLKSASSRRVRNKFSGHVAQFYLKPYFWNRAYYIGSVGNVTLETIRRYVEQQGTKESLRKSKGPACPTLGFAYQGNAQLSVQTSKPCNPQDTC